MLRIAMFSFILNLALSGSTVGQVVINEVVVDPQQDWNDSSGGNLTPFDAIPGSSVPTSADEWLELKNVSSSSVDLTDWAVVMLDATPAVEVLGTGSPLVFSSGGSLADLRPGEYVAIGDPPGQMNNTIVLQLEDAAANVVDAVVLGSGAGPDGNSTAVADEAVARSPDGTDTDDDTLDLKKQRATIGSSNGLFLDGFESGDTLVWSSAFG